LISKGEIEEDGIRPIIIVTGEEELFHPGERDFKMDFFNTLALRSLKKEEILFDP
jgi:hypothetical protein